MSFKLISLDVWNTLLSSNPEYATHRNTYLSKELKLPIQIIESIYQRVKTDYDKIVEKHSICFSNEQTYKKLLILADWSNYDWMKLRENMERIFVQYPPHVLPETIEGLSELQESGIKLSIASNTNFIRGKILNEAILSKLKIDWSFQVFSDEIKWPKPHNQFWVNVISTAYKNIGIMSKDIVHIGDNKLCDGSCVRHGIDYKQVNNPNDLRNILENLHV